MPSLRASAIMFGGGAALLLLVLGAAVAQTVPPARSEAPAGEVPPPPPAPAPADPLLDPLVPTPAPVPPPPAPSPAIAPEPAKPRDPTVPQGELRLLLHPPTDPAGSTAPAAPAALAPALPPLPPLQVRAKLIRGDGQAAALLTTGSTPAGVASGGEFYQVTTGQSFHLGSEWNLTIVSITRDGVTLELQPGKRQLVLP